MISWALVLFTFAALYLWVGGVWPMSIVLVLIGLGCLVYGHYSHWRQNDRLNSLGREHSEICRRADSQHAAWLGGDILKGMYGDWPPNQLFAPVDISAEKTVTNPTVLPGMKADQHWPILKRVSWVADQVKRLSSQERKTPQDFSMILAGDRWLKIVAEQLGIEQAVMVALARTDGASILTTDHRHLYVTGDGQILDSKGDEVESLKFADKQRVRQIINQRHVIEARAQARKVSKTLTQRLVR